VCTLLASSSKDNTRIMLARIEMDSYGFRVYVKHKLLLYLLTSSNGSHLVCQVMPAYSSMSNPNVGNYKVWTELSPPAAYLSTMGNEANKDNL